MRLKSFHGGNLTEAMRAVRDALGENAIIVATREDDQGGIRVTAAIDDAPVHAHAPARQIHSSGDNADPVASASQGSMALETIAEALTRHQVASPLADKLMATATQCASDDPLLALAAGLDMHFKFQAANEDQPLMLIGPPGAGKTLCCAKFATKLTLAKQRATVVCTDLERAGAIEQLSTFTRLLKLNLVEIEDCHALRDIVIMQKGHPLIIDTAGINPFSQAERHNLRGFVAAAGSSVLVMPAGMDAGEALDMAHQFRELGAVSLLMTRLDIVKRLGSLLRLAYEARLPLANMSASAKVTEPPAPMNPVLLARLILNTPAAQTHSAQAASKTADGGYA